MPLNTDHPEPMYLTGRLAALGDTEQDRLEGADLDLALSRPQAALPMLVRRIAAAGNDDATADIFEMIEAGGLPMGPIAVERQMGFWSGYYHQRGYPRQVRIARDDLEDAGQAMFGARWQTDMAEALGYADAARLRAILRGERGMAGGAVADLVAQLRHRSDITAAIADRLELLLATDG